MSTQQEEKVQQTTAAPHNENSPQVDGQSNTGAEKTDPNKTLTQDRVTVKEALEGLYEIMRVVDRIRSEAIGEWELSHKNEKLNNEGTEERDELGEFQRKVAHLARTTGRALQELEARERTMGEQLDAIVVALSRLPNIIFKAVTKIKPEEGTNREGRAFRAPAHWKNEPNEARSSFCSNCRLINIHLERYCHEFPYCSICDVLGHRNDDHISKNTQNTYNTQKTDNTQEPDSTQDVENKTGSE